VFLSGQNNFRQFIFGGRKLRQKLPKIDGPPKSKLFSAFSAVLSNGPLKIRVSFGGFDKLGRQKRSG
jgi:hypothetical protein